MSEENKIQNEEELWDLLSDPIAADPKAARQQKPVGKFSQPRTAKPQKAAPAPKPKPAPAPAAKPEPAATPAGTQPKKVDSFFITCMAGVAAVSVALTLVLSSMFGGSKPNPGPAVQDPVPGETVSSAALEELQLENAELRAQLEQQKKQIKDLQADLLKLMGSEEYLATAPSDPEGGNEVVDAQVEAYAIFAQIQEAYADFDRAKLEELIPEMDERLSYLSSDALNNYYLILEYVEQPSNG